MHLAVNPKANGPIVTLFDLPAEIRLQIYTHLLPTSPRIWTDAMTKRFVSSRPPSPSSNLPSPACQPPTNPAGPLLSLAYTCRTLYYEAMSHLYASLDFELLIHPSGSYAFAPAVMLNNRSKTPRQLRVGHDPSSFPAGLCEQALPAMNQASVILGPLPTELPASRKAALERVFERFSATLQEAPLGSLIVKYTLSRRAQSGSRSTDSNPPIPTQRRSTPGSFTSSDDFSPLEPTRSTSWNIGSSAANGGIVSSPIEIHHPREGTLLETRLEQVLVSKLNPLLKRVKENKGFVSVGEVNAAFAWEWAWIDGSVDGRPGSGGMVTVSGRASSDGSSTRSGSRASRQSSGGSTRSVRSNRSTRSSREGSETNAHTSTVTVRLRQPTLPSGPGDAGRRRLAWQGSANANGNALGRRRGGAVLFPDVPI